MYLSLTLALTLSHSITAATRAGGGRPEKQAQRYGGKAEQIIHAVKARGARERRSETDVRHEEGRGARGRVCGCGVNC